MTTPKEPFTPDSSNIQAYLRGRLEYGRFVRQAAKLKDSPEITSLPPLSVLDFYPSDRPFGDMEQGKVVILSCYSDITDDEEETVATIAHFLLAMTQSALLPQLVWVIGAAETELETVNLFLSYALLAASMEADVEPTDEDPEGDGIPDINLEDQIRVLSLETVRSALAEALCPFDVFWPGLGKLSVFSPDSIAMPQLPLSFDRPESLATNFLQALQEFRDRKSVV